MTLQDLDIIDLLHEAVAAFLPEVGDDRRRDKALTFLRGCEAYRATRPGRPLPVACSVSHRTHTRTQKAVHRTRQSAIAAVADYLQHEGKNFGVAINELHHIHETR